MDEQPGGRWSAGVLATTWAASTLLYAAVATVVFRSFVVTGFDNAVVEQVVARLAHLSAPVTEVEGVGVNYFGDHFSPVLALYAPFYRLVPTTETLFVVQGAVLGLSVVVVLRTASRLLGRRHGAALTLLYALSFGLLHGVVMGARETPFAVLLLALAGSAYLTSSTRGVLVWSLCLLLVKEDLGLTVAAIGAVLALRPSARRAGVALAVVGLVTFVVVTWVVIPAFAPPGGTSYLTGMGPSLDGAAAGWTVKGATLAATFGAAGLLCLTNRWSLVTVPTFAWRFTSSKPAYWSPLWHYSAPLMPVVFLAAAAAAGRAGRRERRLALAVAAVVTALTLGYAATGPARSVAAAFSSDRADAARRALEAIPPGAVVVSDDYLVNHLVGDRTTFYVPTFRGCPRPDHVVAHVGPPERHVWGDPVSTTDFTSAQDLLAFAETSYDADFDVEVQAGQLVVLQRTSATSDGPCTESAPDATFGDPRD